MRGALHGLALPTWLPRPTEAPQIHPPAPALCLRTERGVSQGLGSPQAVGPSLATNSRWLSPLTQHRNPCHCITPVMATQPLLPEQPCPAPPGAGKDGPASADGCSGLCRWSMGDLSREPTRCHRLGEQNQPAGAGPSQPHKSILPLDPIRAPQ